MSEKTASLAKLQKQTANQSNVLTTLLAFCLALAILPIGSYFATLWYVFNGNTTYSAITAIVAANLVLFAYIILSVRDDSEAQKTAQARKEQ